LFLLLISFVVVSWILEKFASMKIIGTKFVMYLHFINVAASISLPIYFVWTMKPSPGKKQTNMNELKTNKHE